MKLEIKALNIKVNSIGGLIHVTLIPVLAILALFNKRFLTLFLVFAEFEALSWAIFNNACLMGFGYQRSHRPNYKLGQTKTHRDFVIPESIHILGYMCRIYLFSTMSTLLNTLGYALLFLPKLINAAHKNGKKMGFLDTNTWSYLTIPFILYIFNNNNGPLSMQHIRAYPNIPIYGAYIATAYLFYNFMISGFEKNLRLPIVVGFALIAFIYGFTWYSVHSEPAQNTA